MFVVIIIRRYSRFSKTVAIAPMGLAIDHHMSALPTFLLAGSLLTRKNNSLWYNFEVIVSAITFFHFINMKELGVLT
ncbi:hypothetical protein ACEQPO_12635 [Bacillus sp. SL00103]